ncbi:hypothetical protein ACWGID_17935 [Kribbella sp. NPDC054772]
MAELVLRPIGPGDVEALQELIESGPGYRLYEKQLPEQHGS